MTKWIDMGLASDYPPGTKVCTEAEGKPIVLMNVEGDFFAVANVCPHAGLPLGEGELAGKVLQCPFHGYTYNVETGTNIDYPRDEPPVPTYPTRLQGDRLEVQVD